MNNFATKGFTKLELLMAFGIIAVLMTIAIPVVGNYVGNARKTSDRQTLTVLNKAINDYKTIGGEAGRAALTQGKSFVNLLAVLKTPVNWAGPTMQFLKDNETFPHALTVEASGSGIDYKLTRYNTYDEGGGSAVLSGGWDMTNEEFDIPGATYYAVAPAGYSYSEEQTTNYSTRKYNTLAAAEAALPASPTTPLVINIVGTWGSADTTPVGFAGVATSASNYLVVRTIGTARHQGYWTTTAHRIETTNSDNPIYCNIGFIKLIGLQCKINVHEGYLEGIDFRTIPDNAWVLADSCIVWGNNTGVADQVNYGVKFGFQASGNSRSGVLRNSIIYGWKQNGDGFSHQGVYANSSGWGAGVSLENNTIVDCYIGMNGYSIITAKNNLIQSCTTSTWGTFSAGSSNNCTDSGTPPGSNPVSGSATFVNAGSADYHLAGGDAVAREAGVDLSGSFTTDIDGDTRSAPWSIGADQ